MASIEARMKRLDSMARKVYLSLSTLEEQEQGQGQAGPSRETVVCPSPLAPTMTESETHHMPEWKFFDKVCVSKKACAKKTTLSSTMLCFFRRSIVSSRALGLSRSGSKVRNGEECNYGSNTASPCCMYIYRH